MINDNGDIEAVDNSANVFLGIPNLIRDGYKLKISLAKNKNNLFKL